MTWKTIVRLLPGGYLILTRLTSVKAIGFHSLMEWVPAVLLVFVTGMSQGLMYVLVYYLAFLSVYEIGYFVNDWQAQSEQGGRRRSENFSPGYAVVFVAVRVTAFFIIGYYTRNLSTVLWWSWFGGLAILFTCHNLLRIASLKVVTFMGLAFFRFFSPLVFLLPQAVFSVLVFPVFACYVVFRAFTYADSKSLLIGFERKSTRFRVGYFALLMPLCIILSYYQSSVFPFAACGYFLLVSVLLSVGEKLLSGHPHSSD